MCPLGIVRSGGVWSFFFFKQKTAYEISNRDWSSDVCSSDLGINELNHCYLRPAGHAILTPVISQSIDSLPCCRVWFCENYLSLPVLLALRYGFRHSHFSTSELPFRQQKPCSRPKLYRFQMPHMHAIPGNNMNMSRLAHMDKGTAIALPICKEAHQVHWRICKIDENLGRIMCLVSQLLRIPLVILYVISGSLGNSFDPKS